jgi:hypothetical protein
VALGQRGVGGPAVERRALRGTPPAEVPVGVRPGRVGAPKVLERGPLVLPGSSPVDATVGQQRPGAGGVLGHDRVAGGARHLVDPDQQRAPPPAAGGVVRAVGGRAGRLGGVQGGEAEDAGAQAVQPPGQLPEVGQVPDAPRPPGAHRRHLGDHAPVAKPLGQMAPAGADDQVGAGPAVDRLEPVVAQREVGGQRGGGTQVGAVLEHDPARTGQRLGDARAHHPRRVVPGRVLVAGVAAQGPAKGGPGLGWGRVPLAVDARPPVLDAPSVGGHAAASRAAWGVGDRASPVGVTAPAGRGPRPLFGAPAPWEGGR